MPKARATTPGITFKASPNAIDAVLAEWGASNGELWSLDLSHDPVEREQVTGGDGRGKASAGIPSHPSWEIVHHTSSHLLSVRVM